MRRDLVFTAYNRPEYLQPTINSWNRVRNLSQWETTFYIEPSEVQDVVVDIALALNGPVTTRINSEVLGVLVNPWNALNTSFEGGADFVVLAEDDIIVSQDTIEMFEWASVEYATSKNVMIINAFSDIGGGKPNQLTQSAHFSPLVWGVWKKHWENHLRDTWDKDYSTGNPDGSEAGWDWNINRILTQLGNTTLKPLQSRSDHIGVIGTHMTPDLMDTSKGADFQATRGRQRYNEV